MVDAEVLKYCAIGALSVAPLYTYSGCLSKKLTGNFLPGTGIAGIVSVLELAALGSTLVIEEIGQITFCYF